MDLESTQNNAIAKLPFLKQGDYEMWKLRIEQYFQVQDYAIWDVIENGNSFKPVPQTTTNADARSMLLMALPNEHLLTFSQYKDAKTLFEAIQARFGGNDATKKTQRNLLKQMYENLNAPSTESLDSIFNRLQKIVSQLAILDLDTMSIDDLYNNFKVVEQEVKRTVVSGSSSRSPNMAFLSSPGSTNKVDTASIQVSVVSTPFSTVSSHDNTANLKQIYEDDLEEIDLKWQLALLSKRARRYFHRTGKKITINGSDTARYDKTKVECFNCHKIGHFARECRSLRNQESRPRNQDISRKTVIVEDTSSKAMVETDGADFDWSYMVDDEVPTNMALMAFSDLEIQNTKTCFNTCLKSYETLKTQYDNLRIEFNKSEFDLAAYKRGLASVEEQLVFCKKNEVVFYDQITVFKRDASFRDSEITALNLQIEKLKKEKESNQIKIDNFENASKSLDKLIGSLFAPPSIDLSNSCLEEFQHPEFKGYGPKDSKSVCIDTSNEIKKAPDAPIIKDWVSDSDEDESKEMVLKSDNV
nr:hypothetical protein [Tanacetum cinerariifolium]